ncbi:MAG: phosphoenolpyruvate--protein phosphotransferase [Acidobacteriota bacterium]
MPLEIRFNCQLAGGVHARPASALEELTARFRSEFSLVNERNGCRANARSVLALVASDIRLDDACRLEIAGPDEQEAHAEMARFLRERFPCCDNDIPTVQPPGEEFSLPPDLRESTMTYWRATPAAAGIGLGRIVEIEPFELPETLANMRPLGAEQERRRIEEGLYALNAALAEQAARMPSDAAAGIVAAHQAIARDPEFRASLIEAVTAVGLCAARAVAESEAHFSRMLMATSSELLHQRVLDVQDVCRQLLDKIYGEAARRSEAPLTEDAICLAESLTPSQLLALDRRYLKGLVLFQPGTTSHVHILARSFGIPTLTRAVGLTGRRIAGELAVVDAEIGLLATNLDETARRYYAMEQDRLRRRQARLLRLAEGPGDTSDGQPLQIAANISSADEAACGVAAGADGVGLFRTEMLFMNRDRPPSEGEQFEEYRRALYAAAGKPVIIRTLDAGGDKPLPFLNQPVEANPFLGCRGVRLYPRHEALFRAQVRALLRASVFGPLKMLAPMVSHLDEVRWMRRIVEEESARIPETGQQGKRHVPLGVMLEVPSIAFALDHFCREVDFFSIGSNDLLQYFLAADRANPGVSGISDPLSPGFLRLLKKAVDDVHTHGKRIGLCGEMAISVRYLPLLVGLGLDEISVAVPAVAEIKAALARLSSSDCSELLTAVLRSPTAREAAECLDRFHQQSCDPIVDENLILMSSGSRTKAEAIKEIVDNFFVQGRTDRPRDVEVAIWQRESVYSTGLGYGIAIPHCKSDSLRADTMGLLRLDQPVDWGSVDGQPVKLVILLGLRESSPKETHMRIFSRLARRLMHEDFRARLIEPCDPASTLNALQEELELA